MKGTSEKMRGRRARLKRHLMKLLSRMGLGLPHGWKIAGKEAEWSGHWGLGYRGSLLWGHCVGGAFGKSCRIQVVLCSTHSKILATQGKTADLNSFNDITKRCCYH